MSDKHIRADDLCAYALAAVGGGYCWGAHGEMCSLSFREELARRAPDQSVNLLGVCTKWDGKRVWDCSGLFRGAWRALWQYRSGGATGIWDKWCTGAKGTIDTMPDRPGIAVFVKSKSPGGMSHIGLYVGGGMVVDANGSRTGVLHRAVSAHGWTHWAELDDADYENSLPSPEEVPALYTGVIKTKTGNGISLWTDNTKKVARVKIPEGAAVDVLEEVDGKGFVRARYAGRTGMADKQYIVAEDAEVPVQDTYMATVVDVKTGLNLRTSPDMGTNTILLIPPGKQVEVYPEMAKDGFAYVLYAGKAGYCTAGKLLRAVNAVIL